MRLSVVRLLMNNLVMGVAVVVIWSLIGCLVMVWSFVMRFVFVVLMVRCLMVRGFMVRGFVMVSQMVPIGV